jgi:hypothetical protein
MGVTPVDTSFEPGDERRYGVLADGSTNDAPALQACYAACVNAPYSMRLVLAGTRRTASTLVWDQKVNITGNNRELCVIAADGNFDVIRIVDDGNECRFEEFRVARLSGAGKGIDIVLGHRIRLARIDIAGDQLNPVMRHTIGIDHHAGNHGTYEDLRIFFNMSDGFRMQSFTGSPSSESCNGNRFGNIDSRNNGGWGFNNIVGDSNVFTMLSTQNNTSGGARINDLRNAIVGLYSEGNAGPDLQLTSSSIRNYVVVVNADSQADIDDRGTNNFILDLAQFATLSVPQLVPISPAVAAAPGKDMSISSGGPNTSGGAAGSGRLFIETANAGGSGSANAGDVIIRFGTGVGSGVSGGLRIGSTTNAAIRAHLSAVATLDFNLTSVSSQDLSISVSGASLGDTVSLGVPHGSVTANTMFTAWVSAANTVTVRAMRIAGTPNPPSGSFRVDVWKH